MNPQPSTLNPQPVAAFPLARRRGKPVAFGKDGQVTIPIYRTRWHSKKRRKTYVSYVVAWRDASGRHREKRNTLGKATDRAGQLARDIANGNITLEQFSQADKASFLRCLELARPTGKPLELLVAEAAEADRELTPGVTARDCIRFYNRHHQAAAGSAPATPAQVLAEMLIARKRDGASQNTIDDYESRLGRFAQDFTGPLVSITSADINTWLRNLSSTKVGTSSTSSPTKSVSNRTRNNYRGNLVDLYRFAKQSGYLPKSWAVLDDVPRVKNEPVRIVIFTPEEITKLLAAARPNLVPYLAIGAFAGCRHEEMCAPGLPTLDWRQIDFEKSEIHVLPEVARKIGHDRLVPMHANLAAWLLPHAKPNGPICDLANVTNALFRTAARAGLKWKDNGLRKSFISYRLAITKNIGQVADEAGTSPDRIRHNYKKTVPVREAKRWFDVSPTTAEILQLNFNLG